jgi:hypothetical protein
VVNAGQSPVEQIIVQAAVKIVPITRPAASTKTSAERLAELEEKEGAP